jgi:hypothetical protein
MKIEIDIPDMYVEVISRWASVSRTLDVAEDGCIEASANCSDERDREKYVHCADEISTLRRPLDVLQKCAQSAIWQKNREQK